MHCEGGNIEIVSPEYCEGSHVSIVGHKYCEDSHMGWLWLVGSIKL